MLSRVRTRLSRRSTEGWASAGPGVQCPGVDVHGGYAETHAVEDLRSFQEGEVRRRPDFPGPGQGDPLLQPPQVTTRIRVDRDQDVDDLEKVRHRPRVRHGDIHRGRQRPDAAYGDDTARRRVGAQGVVGRWTSSARPRLLGQRERREAGRGRHRRSVRGPGGVRRSEKVGVVRALGPTVETALHATVRHRGHVGLARQMAPPVRKRLTVNASRCATSSANAGLPAAAVIPSTR